MRATTEKSLTDRAGASSISAPAPAGACEESASLESPAVTAPQLRPGSPVDGRVEQALAAARGLRRFGLDMPATLAWCVDVGRRAPRPGGGRTGELWQLLGGTAAMDVAAARILEPHLDALAILEQAGVELAGERDPWGIEGVGATPDSSWGVFAAESPDSTLRATTDGSAWTLHGTKAWCSLAQHVTHALVTAFVDDSQRRLFAVDMRGPRVHPRSGPWRARGLPQIVSAPVDFDGAPAVAVGDTGWYLTRPGFAWGGMSVAAVWWGGAEGLRASLAAAASSARADQLALVHLGRVDAALWAARAVLSEAATLIDAHAIDARAAAGDVTEAKLLAERVRAIVADAATTTLAEADAALGPAPLVADESHARRVADLHLYLRQHHGPRDLARIGRMLAGAGSSR